MTGGGFDPERMVRESKARLDAARREAKDAKAAVATCKAAAEVARRRAEEIVIRTEERVARTTMLLPPR